MAVGFTVLSLIAITESLASHDPDGSDWTLGTPEEIGWIYALLIVPVVFLTPMPRGWAWGFVWAVTPVGLTWFTFDLATGVSAYLHYADAFWVDAASLAFIYLGLVPWASWRGFRDALRARTTSAPTA